MKQPRRWQAKALGAVAVLLLLSVAPAAAVSAVNVCSGTYDVANPNGLHVTYESSGSDGQPELIYATPLQTRTFSGAEIRTVATSDLGTLVSVTTRLTIDSGSTSFTLLIPRVNLADGATEAPIEVIGVTTLHRFSVVPEFDRGQLDLSTAVALTGTLHLGP